METLLPYHQLMTPMWLHENADFIGSHALKPQYLEILPTTIYYQQALQVQLVAPDILMTTDCVSVMMTIAMDTTWADKRDHDPIFGISDGTSFIGFDVPDRTNYHSVPPCFQSEADSINGTLQNKNGITNAPLVSSRLYSSEVKLQIRPTERWASCHTEHDEGTTNIANYNRKLDLTNGLYLEMYHSEKYDDADKAETYRIKYIVVDVTVD